MTEFRNPQSFDVAAEASLFGYDPAPVTATITPRSNAWRIGGASGIMGAFVVVAPFAALFPPHAVWPIGALLTGGFLARRRYVEHFTVERVEGSCPKCAAPISTKPTRLLDPHPLSCDGCHHSSILKLPEGTLQEQAAA